MEKTLQFGKLESKRQDVAVSLLKMVRKNDEIIEIKMRWHELKWKSVFK